MAKFEITNPEAIKLIADLKSGKTFQPFLDKIRKIKWILVSICIFFILLIFYGAGKSLFQSSNTPVFLPPNLDTPQVSTETKQKSEFDALKDEIFNFSADLPDPVMPDLSNKINLQPEE